MFQKTLEKMRKNEGGFTLIELLVVMIIIGLLAAIAIPVFLSQKDKAKVSAVQSDLRNAAVYMESAYTTNGSDYPTGTTAVAAIKSEGFRSSDGVTINAITANYGTDKGYCIDASHSGLTDTYKFATATGKPEKGGCW